MDPVRSRRRLFSEGYHGEEQCTVPDILPAGLSCALAAVLLCDRSVKYLPRKSLEVYATSRAWHALLPQGLPIDGILPVCAVAADSTAKKAGPDLFKCRSTGPSAVNLTRGKVFHSGIGICSRLQRTSSCPQQHYLQGKPRLGAFKMFKVQ